MTIKSGLGLHGGSCCEVANSACATWPSSSGQGGTCGRTQPKRSYPGTKAGGTSITVLKGTNGRADERESTYPLYAVWRDLPRYGPVRRGKDTLLLARGAFQRPARALYLPAAGRARRTDLTDIEISVTPRVCEGRGASEHAFSWDAHRTRYATARGVDTALAANGRCLLNVSRTIIDDGERCRRARRRGVPFVHHMQRRELRERLLARRESASAIDERPPAHARYGPTAPTCRPSQTKGA